MSKKVIGLLCPAPSSVHSAGLSRWLPQVGAYSENSRGMVAKPLDSMINSHHPLPPSKIKTKVIFHDFIAHRFCVERKGVRVVLPSRQRHLLPDEFGHQLANYRALRMVFEVTSEEQAQQRFKTRIIFLYSRATTSILGARAIPATELRSAKLSLCSFFSTESKTDFTRPHYSHPSFNSHAPCSMVWVYE